MIATVPKHKTAASRDDLIMEHLPQVKLIASRIHKGVPPSVSLEDLISAGTVGLIAAIDRYKTAHGVKLKTYAEHKIRGAILDSLRVLDWAPRQQRRRVKMIDAAVAELEQSLGRAPEDEEIAERLGLSVVQYQDWLAETRQTNFASLEPGDSEKDGGDLLRFVFDSEERWPSRLLERAELERLLARALGGLPKLEQTILALYYHEELTLREISKVVDLHESRVSQLKAQAIQRLRAYLQTYWPQQGVVSRPPAEYVV